MTGRKKQLSLGSELDGFQSDQYEVWHNSATSSGNKYFYFEINMRSTLIMCAADTQICNVVYRDENRAIIQSGLDHFGGQIHPSNMGF